MKTLFIPVYSKQPFNSKNFLIEAKRKLPQEISIFYSIQFENLAKESKQVLEKNNFNVLSCNQILGCSKPFFKKNPQAILLFSNGKFHAISLAFETNLPTFLFDTKKLERISESEVFLLRKNKNQELLKFLNSKRIGIIISMKKGQSRYSKVLELIHDLEKKYLDKKFFLFLSDSINKEEFQNFDIDLFLNSACPRLDMTHNLLHINDLKKLEE
jgi:diphthamide biosynthesis enzyme Dph1/Dph2-like protein